MPDGDPSTSQLISRALAAETEQIRDRRLRAYDMTAAGARPEPEPAPAPGPPDADVEMTRARLRVLDEHVVGLSFSGGGIRSGTFAVGFLQGLASQGLLRRIDYLSTVSGGGYAGAWLAAWLKRAGDVPDVEQQLNPSNVAQAGANRVYLEPYERDGATIRPVVDEEPEPLFHLRSYSSYMAPRLGLLTADTWTIIAIWTRNVLINLLMLLPLTVLVVLVARLVVVAYGQITSKAIEGSPLAQALALTSFALGAACLGLAFVYNALSLGEFRARDPARRRHHIESRVYELILYPLIGAAVLVTLSILPMLWWLGDLALGGSDRVRPTNPGPADGMWYWLQDFYAAHAGLLGLPNILLHALAVGAVMAVAALVGNIMNRTTRTPGGRGLWFLSSRALLAGASGGVLLAVLESIVKALLDQGRPDLVATIAPPAALLATLVAVTIEVALMGREVSEAEREWWARIGALALIAAILWAVGVGTILYVPALVLAATAPVRAALASGWLATTAFGVLTGKYALPRRPKDDPGWLGRFAALAPPVFLIGLLGAVALLVAYLVNIPEVVVPGRGGSGEAVATYLQGLAETPWWILLAWLLLASFLAFLGSRLIDVNLFSLHAMYANRLTRCYLGASRPKHRWPGRWRLPRNPGAGGGATSLGRDPAADPPLPPDRDENPVTGFDPEDDIPLYDLRIGPGEQGRRAYEGPVLLINATLNLVAGEELAWRDRKGEAFVLSPLYCGSRSLGYAEVTPASRDNLTLGRAMAISGAAVDPNMRFYQSASLTALLTLFNARLGYWMQNPNDRDKPWVAESPRYGDLLVKEFLGRTTGKGPFVHLSDGGHFENMGVYELIRRRCRYIIAVDAGEDVGASDENLAILIRLCRIDFGVRIQLDTRPLTTEGPDRLSRSHVVVGRVRYDDVDNGQMPGILVYVKISMTGDEPSDVQQYARVDPRFPHQPTDLRQSFDEQQFESYRALGDHIARVVFDDPVQRMREEEERSGPFFHKPKTPRDYIWGNQRLFSAVRNRWAEPPSEDERQLQASRDWTQLQRDLRGDAALSDLSRDLYPELPPPPAPAPAAAPAPVDRDRAELHAVGQMLQLMEDAWMELGLKGHYDLPMDRGWMNVFRRWAGTRAFRKLWPVLRAEFSPEFIRFCEVELHLVAARPPECYRLDPDRPAGGFEAGAIAALAEEFAREWPDEVLYGRDLGTLVRRADRLGASLHGQIGGKPPIWLIVQAPADALATAVESPEKFACGILLVADGVDLAGRPVPCCLDPSDQPIPNCFEFFAWVRRPLRSIGLGSASMKVMIEEVRAQLDAAYPTPPFTLRVRYPKPGGAGDLELGMWRNFFALYDFSTLDAPIRISRKESVLELKR